MHFLIKLMLLASLVAASHQTKAQVFLQLERFNNPKSLKFEIGETLEFRLKEFPDTWRKEIIIDLIADEQLIVFEDNYYSVQEIKNLRLRYPAVKTLGLRFMQFSAAWLVYGGIATLASEGYTIGSRELLIGGSFALGGYLMRTIFSKKKVKLSSRKRLRVMDLRFTIDGFN